jgi:RimJ/RimL family protein N-acetyltransferase
VYKLFNCNERLVIETERFIIRTLTIADASARYLSWFSTDATQFIENKASNLSELKQYIQYFSSKDGCWLLGIFTRDEQMHIGNIKFESISTDDRALEMGILIGDKNWQGKGVANEVIQALGYYFKDNYKKERIVLGVDKRNTPAIKAYEKAGFIKNNSVSQSNNNTFRMVKDI